MKKILLSLILTVAIGGGISSSATANVQASENSDASSRMDIAGPNGLTVRRENIDLITVRSVATGIRNGGSLQVRAWMEGFFGDEMGTSSGWISGNTSVTARSKTAGVAATARGAMR